MIQIGNNKIQKIMYRGTDDVARAVLGGDWRMPTKEEWQELMDNCDFQISGNGNYYIATSRINGNSIMLPLCGDKRGTTRNYGQFVYWTSSKFDNRTSYRVLSISKIDNQYKNIGMVVRPVSSTRGIDLGFSVNWCDRNIGALQPQEFGNYYAWGEIVTKSAYSWATYKFNPSGDGQTFTKYNSQDGKTTLELDCICEYERVMEGGDFVFFKPIEYSKDFSAENLSLVSACAVLDALQEVATTQTITFSSFTTTLINESDVALGKVFDAIRKGWQIGGGEIMQTDDVAYFYDTETRMPTSAEFQELIDNTTMSIIYDGDNSYLKYEGINGEYIILPNIARHWASTLEKETIADSLLQGNRLDGEYRYRGKPIRAVSTTKGVDLGLPSGLKWLDRNVGANSISERGVLVAWGEILEKSEYTWNNYKWGTSSSITKYNSTDGLTTLQKKY